MCKIGDNLSDVAEKAGVTIPYQCRKGECGTCEVSVNNQWIKTCQTQIPYVENGASFVVKVSDRKKKSAAFFSPRSLAEGFFNNAAGMVGLVVEGAKSDDEFKKRMDAQGGQGVQGERRAEPQRPPKRRNENRQAVLKRNRNDGARTNGGAGY